MSQMFILFYIIPLIVVLVGSASFVKRNQNAGLPMFFLAILPAANILAAFVVVVILLFTLITKQKA